MSTRTESNGTGSTFTMSKEEKILMKAAQKLAVDGIPVEGKILVSIPLVKGGHHHFIASGYRPTAVNELVVQIRSNRAQYHL